MEALIVVLLVALLGIAGVAVWLLAQRRAARETETQRLEQQLLAVKGDLAQIVGAAQQTLLGQVNAVDAKLNQRLDAVQGNIDRSLTSTSETIGKIGEQLGALGESARRILEVGQYVSSLKDVLQPPKLRGGFGELQLERILADCGLPSNSYRLQHQFPTGVQVDAVVIIGGGLVPVDSKFPMEGFNRMMAAGEDERSRVRRAFLRDVQKHVDAVCKYI